MSVLVACLELVAEELANPINEKKKGKNIRDLVVPYKNKIIRTMDVEMEKYNCIYWYRDARLMNFWEDVRSQCILVYMYDLKKPTDNQKHVESLDKISVYVAELLPQTVAIETKYNVSGVEDLTDSQANIWADSLIVSPVVHIVKPVTCRLVIRYVSNFLAKPTPIKPISTSPPKLVVKASPPVQLKQKGKSSYYLPVSLSPLSNGKLDCRKLSDKHHTNFTVRLKDRFCDCRKWQLTVLPCKHATRCIFKLTKQLEDYIEDCFTMEKYRNLYNYIVHPITAL
ncbi:hypothetical protein Cgig2_004368 [Carnegiea gigantea]|uniref:SWIM-type domain-containing protein n=1 Tax=Carnegiea gigantea TaxID=171969 RepID=A0A9Q1GXY4_9CARY|nr:hypothetical protein Cgig2_004368 [Carnegiea gigantea]